jgi:HEAT repeat protein
MKYVPLICFFLVLGACGKQDEGAGLQSIAGGGDTEKTSTGLGGATGADMPETPGDTSQPGGAPPHKLMQYTPSQVEEIVRRIKSGDQQSREMAYMSLPRAAGHFEQHPELLPELVIPTMVGILTDKAWSDNGRNMVATDLCGLGSAGVPALLEAIENPGMRNVIAFSAHKLGDAGTPLMTRFVELLKSDDAIARGDATRALGGFGPKAKEAVPALIELLKNDKKTGNRRDAASALGNIGEKSAISALQDAAKNDKFGPTRFQAEQALKKLQQTN